MPDAESDQLRHGADANAFHHGILVEFDRLGRDTELHGDLFDHPAFSEQREDLFLPLAQFETGWTGCLG
jgi:hypothetical protein